MWLLYLISEALSGQGYSFLYTIIPVNCEEISIIYYFIYLSVCLITH